MEQRLKLETDSDFIRGSFLIITFLLTVKEEIQHSICYQLFHFGSFPLQSFGLSLYLN